MDTSISSAPKLHALGTSWKLLDNETVAINLNESTSNEESFILSDKPLKPMEIFTMEIEDKLNRNFQSIIDGKILSFHLTNMDMKCLKKKKKMEETHSTAAIVRRLIFGNTICSTSHLQKVLPKKDFYNSLHEALEHSRRTVQGSEELPLLKMLSRHMYKVKQERDRNINPNNLIGLFYTSSPFPNATYAYRYFLYVVSTEGCFLQYFSMEESTLPMHLVIKISADIRQIRSITLFPSLEELSEMAILKKMLENKKLMTNHIEEWPLPQLIIKNLLDTAEYKNII